jgi:DNA polymerase I
MEKILLFDMQNICWRSEFAMSPLTVEPFGEITAVFGGLKTMLKIAKETGENWDYVYCCFDTQTSLRKQISPTYKAKRAAVKDPEKIELKARFNKQMNYMSIILRHLGFTTLEVGGFEADDLIAKQCVDNQGAYKVIISNDEDLYQLLDTNTIIYKSEKGGVYRKIDVDYFRGKYGIEPSQWAMVKAIAGCETDEIDGITGVGEKRAIQYLRDELTPKYKVKITEGAEIIKQNLRLVVLPFTEATIPKLNTKTKFVFNSEYFEKLCEVLHFRSFKTEDWELAWT